MKEASTPVQTIFRPVHEAQGRVRPTCRKVVILWVKTKMFVFHFLHEKIGSCTGPYVVKHMMWYSTYNYLVTTFPLTTYEAGSSKDLYTELLILL